jgi:hypothetical protein
MRLTEKADQTVVRVTGLRAEAYSAEGEVIVSLQTRLSTAERKYSIPVECFRDLIVDLQRLSLTTLVARTDANNKGTETRLPLPSEWPRAS